MWTPDWTLIDTTQLTGEQLHWLREYVERMRLLNAGCRPDGTYETCDELKAKWAVEDAPFEKECEKGGA